MNVSHSESPSRFSRSRDCSSVFQEHREASRTGNPLRTGKRSKPREPSMLRRRLTPSASNRKMR